MAEIELSIFSKQCLKRGIGGERTLRREIAALQRERNETKAVIDWRFTTTGGSRQTSTYLQNIIAWF